MSLELAQHRSEIISEVNYRLHFDVPAEPREEIAGHVVIEFLLAEHSDSLQIDFRESGDKIKNVLVNGDASAYSFLNEHIVVPRSELNVGPNEIEIDFVAGDSSLNRNPEYLYTLFVPDRARTAFPLFDQPDIKATYELKLDVPQGWKAMSIGPIETVTDNGERAAFQFRKSDLVSSYLFSFVAGRFESVSRNVGGRAMTMLHRENDTGKVERNLQEIFDLHLASLEWLEEYTGIEYPNQKFDFVLIPAFQYGGMEHVGAIQYRASLLFLDESPSDKQLLRRAGLIAHETAHVWFGNLVTMEWFNDVWTKEVFANFMADKIVNPSFPDINHDLNFLVGHYPKAYAVDRSEGANAIRQHLGNLNEAGQLYGPIIYDKAPIMMRQLEKLIGENLFRDGMQEYLKRFSFANATWPDLIEILDARSDQNLKEWSNVWVNTSGRPVIEEHRETTADREVGNFLIQHDSSGGGRVWPQQFGIASIGGERNRSVSVASTSQTTELDEIRGDASDVVIFSSDGLGYGLFPGAIGDLEVWNRLDDVQKGSLLINLYENLLTGTGPRGPEYFGALKRIVESEKNELVLNLALGQLRSIYWLFLDSDQRRERVAELENVLWRSMLAQTESSRIEIYFKAFASISLSEDGLQRVYEVWSEAREIENLSLSENDRIDLAQLLAIKLPKLAASIIEIQISNTNNPDSKRKFEFLAPSLSADQSERDRFFDSLAKEENRQTETWVLGALKNLHHPLRTDSSEKYLLPSLELLQEIQITGDIFFPQNWLNATLGSYRSPTAVRTVRKFLEERPEYNAQLRMKILQSADNLFRAAAIVSADDSN